MRIIVDAFGGDNAPEQILLGCAQARQELGVDILLTGDKARLEACAKGWRKPAGWTPFP